jgi:hypothetical protein
MRLRTPLSGDAQRLTQIQPWPDWERSRVEAARHT